MESQPLIQEEMPWAPEPPKPERVYSTEFGNSSQVFPKVLGLYVKPGAVIADLTIDSGRFWKNVDPRAYRVVGSGIPAPNGKQPFVGQLIADARRTPYRDESFNVVVLDPPYGNASTTPRTDGIQHSYNTESLMTPKEIRGFYLAGIDEAERILKMRGILIVKCQNFVDGGRSHFMEEFIWLKALRQGFFRAEGKINMVPPGKPIMRHPDRPQQHERKNHSIFWIFRKVKP